MKNEDTAFGFSLLPVECMLSGKRSLVLYALFDTSLNCIRHFHLARDTVPSGVQDTGEESHNF